LNNRFLGRAFDSVFFSLRVASCNFVLAICKDTKFSGDLQEKDQLFSSELSD